jgi:Tol biopolymer transport system component
VAGVAAAAVLAVLSVEPAGATFPIGVNGKLAFAGSAGGGEDDVYTANANGSGLQQLVDGGDDKETIWSPDGTKIAYVNNDDGDDEIWVRNADGSGLATKLTDNNVDDRHPNWSPNGMLIAYTEKSGSNEVRVMNAADGSNKTDLSDKGGDNAADDQQPNWSPDGTKIAFSSDRQRGGDLDIWVMEADGDNPVQITISSGEDNMPSWSPDGTKIAFVTRRGGNYDVWSMDADGDNPVQLTSDPADDRDPAWSPDGALIAFDTDREGPQRVYLMNANGSNETLFPSGLQESRTPEWQRLNAAPPPPQPQCADGQDNDGDGKTDLADPGCANASDNSESPDPPAPPSPPPPLPLPVALQSISNVKVYPHGQYVTVRFKTKQAIKKVRAELWKGTKGAAGAQLKRLQIKTSPTAKKNWTVDLVNLTARTKFDQLWVYVPNALGVGGAQYKHPTAVKTRQRNVLVTFGDVQVLNDSDSDDFGEDCGDFALSGFSFSVDTPAKVALASKVLMGTACDGDVFSSGVFFYPKNVKQAMLILFVLTCDDDPGIGTNDCASGSKSIEVGPSAFTATGEGRKGSAVIHTTKGDSAPRIKVSVNWHVAYASW